MELVDVLEVQIATPHTVRLMAEAKTEPNAEAVVKMAVMRRGCDTHFFTTAPTGKYKDGDILSTEN